VGAVPGGTGSKIFKKSLRDIGAAKKQRIFNWLRRYRAECWRFRAEKIPPKLLRTHRNGEDRVVKKTLRIHFIKMVLSMDFAGEIRFRSSAANKRLELQATKVWAKMGAWCGSD
jgi:hypothetical protein